MVYPESKYFDTDDGKKIPLPRIRRYDHFQAEYIAIIQPHGAGPKFRLMQLCASLYSKYKDLDIHYITKRKIRLISTDMGTINSIVADDDLRRKCNVFIPVELCETKAVVEIPAETDITEAHIFKNAATSHRAEYGYLPSEPRITEVKRMTKPDPEKADTRLDIDMVVICFTGDLLPSHISLDRVIFPVKPFIEYTPQCRRCWRYGHTTKACRRFEEICSRCGTSHAGTCNGAVRCVNCNGTHEATSFECHVRMDLRERARVKAELRMPKRTTLQNQQAADPINDSFVYTDVDFPAINSKRPKLVRLNRPRKRRGQTKTLVNDTSMLEEDNNASESEVVTPDERPTVIPDISPTELSTEDVSSLNLPEDADGIIMEPIGTSTCEDIVITEEVINEKTNITKTTLNDEPITSSVKPKTSNTTSTTNCNTTSLQDPFQKFQQSVPIEENYQIPNEDQDLRFTQYKDKC